MNTIVVLCLTAFCFGCVYGQDKPNVPAGNTTDNATAEVLHPSKYPNLECNLTGSCSGGPCQYKQSMVKTDPNGPIPTGMEIGFECGDISGHVKAIVPPSTGFLLLNLTVDCYSYNSSNFTFHAIEALIHFPNKTELTLECVVDKTKNCKEFLRSDTEARLVYGIPDDCHKGSEAVTTEIPTTPGGATTPTTNTTDNITMTPSPPAEPTQPTKDDKDANATTPSAAQQTDKTVKGGAKEGGSSRMEPAIFGIMVAFLAIRYQLSA